MFVYNGRKMGKGHPLLLHPVWQPHGTAGGSEHTHKIRKTFPRLYFPCGLRALFQAISRDLIKKNVFVLIDGGLWQDCLTLES